MARRVARSGTGRRIDTVREELENLVLDIELLEHEKGSLEAQETCMRSLDKLDVALEDGEDG